MRTGKRVWYVSRGAAREATVSAVVGSGPSGYKTLDLTCEDKTHKAVAHENDATGKTFWMEYGSAHAAAEDASEESVPAPVVPEAKAEGRATAGVGDSSEDE